LRAPASKIRIDPFLCNKLTNSFINILYHTNKGIVYCLNNLVRSNDYKIFYLYLLHIETLAKLLLRIRKS
jgi:hypothetical protein